MQTFLLITALWATVISATIFSLAKHHRAFTRLASSVALSGVIVLAVGVTLSISANVPLHGLEYEDAFEYSYAGDLIARNAEFTSGGLNPICVLGSSAHCYMTASLSHPVAYSVLIAWLNRLIGPSEKWSQLLGAMFLLLGAATTLCIADNEKIGSTPRKIALATVVTSPVFVTLTCSGFSEPASAFLIALFFMRLYDMRRNVKCDESVPWGFIARNVALIASILATAVLVRRDNLALLVPSALVAGVLPIDHASKVDRRIVFATTAAALSLGLLLGLYSTGGSLVDLEIVAVPGQTTFSLNHIRTLAPAFLSHISDPTVFGVWPIALLAALLCGANWKSRPELCLLIITQFALCTSFVHSYYFVHEAEAPRIHFERYLYQIWPIAVLVLASFFNAARDSSYMKGWRTTSAERSSMALIFLSLCALFLSYGYATRMDRSREEKIVRFGPIARSLKATPENTWLITEQPIIAALESKGQRLIVDYSMLGRGISATTLAEMVQHSDIYILMEAADLKKPHSRYRSAWALLSDYQLQSMQEISAGATRYTLAKVIPKEMRGN